jgi:hypothetical protein
MDALNIVQGFVVDVSCATSGHRNRFRLVPIYIEVVPKASASSPLGIRSKGVVREKQEIPRKPLSVASMRDRAVCSAISHMPCGACRKRHGPSHFRQSLSFACPPL